MMNMVSPRLRLILIVMASIVFFHLLGEWLRPAYYSQVIQKGKSLYHSGYKSRYDQARKASQWEDDYSARNASSNRANAAFVILARNSDLWEIMGSIRSIEDRFNHKYHYPYVFLNDNPFDDQFKLHTSALASGKVSYGEIPESQWRDHGSWIDEGRAAEARQRMKEKNVIYGDNVGYREMCRYQSGFFFRHPLLAQYDWYWRIEPSVKFFCDIDYDPFLYMQENNMKYAFTISIFEYIETIPTLWDSVKDFMKKYPQHISKRNSIGWLSDDNGETYNRCHFWSNFEIASLDLWRSEAYLTFFEHLDKAGGFFYERWGDAPVHSIAAGLFLEPEQIHWFQDIGYYHGPFANCPGKQNPSCYCNPNDDFSVNGYSCTPQWRRFRGI